MSHDHGVGSVPPNPFEELLRLQSTFQQNLSQATMNYMRQLQGLVGPVTPGTVVQQVAGKGLELSVAPAASATLELVIENRQRVHSMITPMLSPLVSDSGTTWFAEASFSPVTSLLATDETQQFDLSIVTPADIPSGVYRGAVLMYGCKDGVVPLVVTVTLSEAGRKRRVSTKKASTSKKKSALPRNTSKTKRTVHKKLTTKKSARKTTGKRNTS